MTFEQGATAFEQYQFQNQYPRSPQYGVRAPSHLNSYQGSSNYPIQYPATYGSLPTNVSSQYPNQTPPTRNNQGAPLQFRLNSGTSTISNLTPIAEGPGPLGVYASEDQLRRYRAISHTRNGKFCLKDRGTMNLTSQIDFKVVKARDQKRFFKPGRVSTPTNWGDRTSGLLSRMRSWIPYLLNIRVM